MHFPSDFCPSQICQMFFKAINALKSQHLSYLRFDLSSMYDSCALSTRLLLRQCYYSNNKKISENKILEFSYSRCRFLHFNSKVIIQITHIWRCWMLIEYLGYDVYLYSICHWFGHKDMRRSCGNYYEIC